MFNRRGSSLPIAVFLLIVAVVVVVTVVVVVVVVDNYASPIRYAFLSTFSVQLICESRKRERRDVVTGAFAK